MIGQHSKKKTCQTAAEAAAAAAVASDQCGPGRFVCSLRCVNLQHAEEIQGKGRVLAWRGSAWRRTPQR